MGRRTSAKAVFNYTVFAVVLFLAYKIFFEDGSQKPADPFRSPSKEHPKHVRKRPTSDLEEEAHAVKEGLGEGRKPHEDSDDKAKIDVGDLPKDLTKRNETFDNLSQKEKLPFQKHFLNKTGGGNHIQEDEIRQEMKAFQGKAELELEEELKKRKETFMKNLKDREEQLEENEYKHLSEEHDDITFVTASSHSTYYATLQFVYSVQYFYPASLVVIYDIGLTSDEKAFIGSLCNTELASLYLHLWPDNMYKLRHRIWRPLLLQFAVAKFVHLIYVEPGFYIYRQLIKDYLEQSRVHGLVLTGRQMKYSTHYVTNPLMYRFIATDEKKLIKTPHVEMSLMILHNTRRVSHFFLRYLMACTTEEYCISPPGASPNCDPYIQGRNYGRCHRYDESAINVILNKWHNYNPREYFMKDLITQHHDGQDMSSKLKICNDRVET